MNTISKIKFVMTLAKYSIFQPGAGLEFTKWYMNSKKDSHNPKYSYQDQSLKFEDIIKKISSINDISINESLETLKPLAEHINDFLLEIGSKKYPTKDKPYLMEYSIENNSAVILYLLCKAMKPLIVVETGTAYGLSSSYILQAMQQNDKGKLYSIDYISRPWESKKMMGVMIPKSLKNKWNLVYGKTSKQLKPLLDSLGKIDIFIHDSDHTYDNMLFEFNTAWDHIKNDGFLVSDDIGSNYAFHDFCKERKIKPIIYAQNRKWESFLGIVQKRDSTN